jgi:hypothetical protein
MNPLDLIHRHTDSTDILEGGVFRSERRSRLWWWRLNLRIRLEELFEWWECDFCPRRIWAPLLGGHSMRHTDAEWAAAGYDKAGTIAGWKTTDE